MTIHLSKYKDLGYIVVRDTHGTYVAKFRGKIASCTGGPGQAAERVAMKVLGDSFCLEMVDKSEYVWRVVPVEKGVER